jgi:molecular chaperone DnaK (HSP70)
MPHYYGLDYGSTTSLLYEYDDGSPKELSKIKSATRVYNGEIVSCDDADRNFSYQGYLVESPKRDFIDDQKKEYNGVGCISMIANTMVTMLKKQQQGLQGSHFTLTIPNGYSATHYIAMHNIVLQAIERVAPNAAGDVDVYLLPEPMAAALHYIHCCMRDCGDFENKHFVVCDIGGGTTDLSIVTCSRRGRSLMFKVEKNQQSDNNLGGNDFDKCLCRHLGIDERKISNMGRNAIQILKHNLSEWEFDTVEVDNVKKTCTRDEFERCIQTKLTGLGVLMQKLRDGCGLSVDRDWVILRVGGSCRMPAIQHLLHQKFQEIEQVFDTEPIDVFYSVAQGAAIYSAYRAGALASEYDTIEIINSTPHKISYMTTDREWKTIVPQNSPDGTYVSPTLCLIGKAGGVENDDGTYSVGDIMIREDGAEKKMWPRDESKHFNLNNRNILDVQLELSIEIVNSRIHTCCITDKGTNEQNIWTIDCRANG